jgi:hypothetical protein
MKYSGSASKRQWKNRSTPRLNDGIKVPGTGSKWFDIGIAAYSSRSQSRKAASAQIAEIPFGLAYWIARCIHLG